MAIGKPRGRNGMRVVYVYDKRVGRKVYVGSRQALRGPGGAQELFRQKTDEFNGKAPEPTGDMTCERYAERWFAKKHGPGTRRPSPSTEQVNRGALGWLLPKKGETAYRVRPGSFLDLFGDRKVNGGITREEALDWAKEHPANAKVVAAMFTDAKDDERCDENPFANRRLPQKRGRRDIEPLTELEVERLAELALDAWGERYGRVVAGWITFLAWTGCRPGEASAARRDWLDVENGLLTVPRIKGDKQTDKVVLPPAAVQALERMPVQTAAAEADADRLFLTSTGRPYTIGSYTYYWNPVRAAFVSQLEPDRRKELQAVKGSLDVYALRHFCGSVMADRGANDREIAAQLGNSPEVCRKTYLHDYRDRVNERNAMFLGQNVADLDVARRRRKGA